MAMLGRLKDLLENQRIPYEVLTHSEMFTAQEIAAACHIAGKEMAKVVIVKDRNRFVMAVLPASWRLDLRKLKEVLGSPDVRLAAESEFKALFPDCAPGAEPPFGNLYKLDVYVDRSLTEDKKIYFNAGNHFETVGMPYPDFDRLVKPRVAEFAVHLH